MDQFIFPIIGESNKLPIYITGVGGHANQHHITRPKGFHDYQFIYCVKGSGVFFLEGKEYSFKENTGFILYPEVIHEYYSIEEPWETHWITFHGNSLPSLLHTLGFEKSERLNIHKISLLDNILNQTLILAQSDSISKGFKCSGMLYSLLIELRDCISKEYLDLNTMKFQQLQPVLSFIDQNFNKSVTLEDMADVINVSPQYLCRLFKKLLNMRPFIFLTKRRIQEAKQLLLEDVIRIKDITYKVGYNDASYFCGQFKKHEGISPFEFRSLYKNKY